MIAEFKDLPNDWPADKDHDEYYESVYGCSESEVKDHKCSEVQFSGALFPRNDVDVQMQWIYVLVLAAVFTIFRTTACIILSYKANRS